MRPIDADALTSEIQKYANEPVKLRDRRWDVRCKAIIADMIGTVKTMPTVELTDEAAIKHLQASGWMQNHDREMSRPHWISVKDRLPVIDEDVLVRYISKVSGESGITITSRRDEIYFGSSPIKVKPEWRSPWQYFLTNNEITHWMPLPEPPKEDEHEQT